MLKGLHLYYFFQSSESAILYFLRLRLQYDYPISFVALLGFLLTK